VKVRWRKLLLSLFFLWHFDDGGLTNYLVKIVVVNGGFVGGEDLLTKGFLHFQNKMTVLFSRTKWPQSEVFQRQLLAHLKTHFSLIFPLKLDSEVS